MFGTYLIMFYSKYFPGNIYVNYSIPAFADLIYTLYIKVLSDKFVRSSRIIRVLFYALIFWAIIYIIIADSGWFDKDVKIWAVPLLVMLIRLNTKSHL